MRYLAMLSALSILVATPTFAAMNGEPGCRPGDKWMPVEGCEDTPAQKAEKAEKAAKDKANAEAKARAEQEQNKAEFKRQQEEAAESAEESKPKTLDLSGLSRNATKKTKLDTAVPPAESLPYATCYFVYEAAAIELDDKGAPQSLINSANRIKNHFLARAEEVGYSYEKYQLWADKQTAFYIQKDSVAEDVKECSKYLKGQ
jgi:hypothetical protein